MNATIVLLVSLITAGGTVQERKYEMPSMEVCLSAVEAAKVQGDEDTAQQLFCIIRAHGSLY